MDRSSTSRIAVATITISFLLAIFIYRQYQNAQVFELLGVVEGFYGKPWSEEARLDMVRFMGEVGMNAYFYAPKDDPYHRQNWREPYAGRHLEHFRDLVLASEEAGVRLYYAISPGLSIQYSSEDDYQALKAKLTSMTTLGVRHVALFLDDVPESLQHEADREKFQNLGEAHVHLINRLYPDLKAMGVDLIVCPTTYTAAWGDREYVRILGSGIAREIPLFWTGNDVAVATITAADARHWGEKMSRKPLIWDNFPVNDFEVWRPIIGPITGRDPRLAQTTTGLIANPMDAPYLSMIPLYTVAEFGKRPFAYDERKSWQNALSHLAGVEGGRVLRPLALLFNDYGWTDNVFTPLYTPGKQFEINQVRNALTLFEETLNQLKSDEFRENEYIQRIIPELEPFAVSLRSKFDAMMSDRFYRVDPEGFLEFQSELEEITALHAEVQLDGNLTEWRSSEFRPLIPSNANEANRVRAAFRYQSGTLYVGIEVDTDTLHAPNPAAWSGGDQILMGIAYTANRNDTWVEPTDLMLLVRPPSENESVVKKGSFYLTPFSQRGISDITMRTISSFFDHFVGDVHQDITSYADGVQVGLRRTSRGYSGEIAIPVGSRQEIKLTISVNDARREGSRLVPVNFMLQQRPYIGNPHTWVNVVIR